ncbi:MAG: carbonate dehydratase [Chromatiales bacterium]|nr:carbonate dehydratase [Chromatiales bacterium]
MDSVDKLFKNNLAWADKIKEEDPHFFQKLSEQQTPEYLWIGCADSRVPPNEIVDMLPGELFVHRNIANLVVHTDLNCLSVIQYAVDVLKVKHIIVCGHYGCGGVAAAMGSKSHGLIDNWLRHIKDTYYRFSERLETCQDEKERVDLLCELNVAEQVANVCHTTIVQDAWKRGQALSVHGLIYSLKDGVLHDLDVTCEAPEQLPEAYRQD